MDLHKLLKKQAGVNENEILSVQESCDIAEILTVVYQFKVGTSIERKIEQSLISASTTGLQIHQLVKIA